MPILEFKLKHEKTESDNFVWKPVSKWISGNGEVIFETDGISGKIEYAQKENTSLEKRYGEIILYNNYKKFAVFKVAQRGKPFLTFNGTAETYTLNIDGKEHIYIADISSANDSDPIICNIEMHNIVAEDNVHGTENYHDDIYFDKGIFNLAENKWIRPLGYNSIIDTYIDEDSELFEPSEETPISNITYESENENINYIDTDKEPDADTDDSFYTLHIEEEGFIYKLGFNVQQNFTGQSRKVTIDFYNRYPKIDEEYDKITKEDFTGATYENKIIGSLTIEQEPYIEFLIDSVETKSSNIRAVELNDYEYYIESVENVDTSGDVVGDGTEVATEDETEDTHEPSNTVLTKIVDNSYLGEINDDFKPIVKVFNDEKFDTTVLTIENKDGNFLVRHLGIDVTNDVTIVINDVENENNVYPTDPGLYNITIVYGVIEENFIIDNTNNNTINNVNNAPFIERIPNSIYHRTYKQLDNILNYRVSGCSNQFINVKTDADWINIKAVDSRNRKIYYQISENTSEDEREAIIYVTFFGGNTTSFTIKQFGQPSLIFEQSGSNVLDYWVSKTGTSKIEGDEFLEYSLPIKEMKNIIPELLYSININIDTTSDIYPNQQTVIEDIIGFETNSLDDEYNYKHDADNSNYINVTYNTYSKFIALSSRKSSSDEHIISGEITIVEDDTEHTYINTITPTNNTDANSYNICQHMCAVELQYYTEDETAIGTEDGTEDKPKYIGNVSDSLILTTNNNLTKNIIDETIKLIYNDRNIANINLKQYDFDFIFIDPIELNVNSNEHEYHLHYSSDNSNYLRFRLLNEESGNTPTISYLTTKIDETEVETIVKTDINFYDITNHNDTIYSVTKFIKTEPITEYIEESKTEICQHNSAIDPNTKFPSIIVNIDKNPDTSVRGWNIAVDCAPDALFGKVITYVISIEQCGKLTMEILRNDLSNCISFNKYAKEIEFGIYNVDGNKITFDGTTPWIGTDANKEELLSCKKEHDVDSDDVNKPEIGYTCIIENKYSQLNYNKEFNTYSFRCVSRITIPENKIKLPILHNFNYYCPLMESKSTEPKNKLII